MSMTVTWFASQSIRCRAGSSASRPPDQVADPVAAPPRAGAGTPRPSRPTAARASRDVVVVELERDHVAQVVERLDRASRRARTVAVALGVVLALAVEQRLDPRDEVGDLRALVVAPRRTGTAGSVRGRTRGPSSSRRSRLGPALDCGIAEPPAPGATDPRTRPGRRPQPDRLERARPAARAARTRPGPRRRAARSAGRATAGPRP